MPSERLSTPRVSLESVGAKPSGEACRASQGQRTFGARSLACRRWPGSAGRRIMRGARVARMWRAGPRARAWAHAAWVRGRMGEHAGAGTGARRGRLRWGHPLWRICSGPDNCS